MSLPELDIKPNPEAAGKLKKLATSMMMVGLAISVIGLFWDFKRFPSTWLLGFIFIWVIAMGCLFITALHHITAAVWSVVFRRVAEFFAKDLVIIMLTFIPVILLMGGLYGDWIHPDNSIVEGKTAYLNWPFFILRWLIFMVIWGIAANYFVGTSLKQDQGIGGEEATRKMRGMAAPFIIIFAPTATLASFDWLMSLEPLWFSTIFGVYVFAGMMLSGLSVITLMTIWLKHNNALGNLKITGDHYYSLGGLLFAFTCFWGYVGMSQLLLYWYANLPEETFWYNMRWGNGWEYSSLILMFARFVIPFLILLNRDFKMSEPVLVAISIFILFGQVVDIHWLIMPSLQGTPSDAVFRFYDVGPLIMLSGVLIFLVAKSIGKYSPVAVGDPLIEKGRLFHL